jgi:hypothetical protein
MPATNSVGAVAEPDGPARRAPPSRELGRLPVRSPLSQERLGFLLAVETLPRLLAGDQISVDGIRPAVLPLDRARRCGRGAWPATALSLPSCSTMHRTPDAYAFRAVGTLRATCPKPLTSASNKLGDPQPSSPGIPANWSDPSGSEPRREKSQAARESARLQLLDSPAGVAQSVRAAES